MKILFHTNKEKWSNEPLDWTFMAMKERTLCVQLANIRLRRLLKNLTMNHNSQR